MRRGRILVILLCSFGLTLPLLSLPTSSDGECLAGYCSSNSQCSGGTCVKKPGQTCGRCAL